MSKSVWRWNSTFTEGWMSIGLLPYKRSFSPPTIFYTTKIRARRGSSVSTRKH